MKNYLGCLVIFLTLLMSVSSCLATNQSQKESIEQIDQLQLQEDMQRFYSRLISRIYESINRDEDFKKTHTMVLLQESVQYSTEALKIVSSPYPVANFLDMLVFIKLNKIVLRDYWIPKVYGRSGIPILKAFNESENDLENMAQKFMKAPNLKQVDQLVREWRKLNPDYVNVERIRLSDFTKIGLTKEKREGNFSLSGLIVDTQSAVKAVDEIVLVSNRAIFLSQNIIALSRLNMRLGAQEIISDTVSNIQSANTLTHELEKTRPLVHDLTFLAQESGTLIEDLKSILHGGINVHKNLDQMNTVLDKTNSIVTTLNSGNQERKEVLSIIRKEMHSFLWLIVLGVIVAGLFVSLFWWTGYYLCKKKLR